MYVSQMCPGGTVFDPVQSSCLVFEDSSCFDRKFKCSLHELGRDNYHLFVYSYNPTDRYCYWRNQWMVYSVRHSLIIC